MIEYPGKSGRRTLHPQLPAKKWIGLAAAFLCVAGLVAGYRVYWLPRHPDAGTSASQQPRFLWAGANSGYVDPSACAGCHQQIWNAYRQTAMGRSLARARPGVMGGDFQQSNTFYHSGSERHYTMYQRDGKYYQRRHQIGFEGKETNVFEQEIDYVIGSGNHARTYLHRTPEGRLIELPVTWYAEKGGGWAMSPGFDDQHQPDFRRQVMYECIFCHTGYPEIPPGADSSGHEPLFPGRIQEGIDCQRCHGPGREHISAATHGDRAAARKAIVNPSRLSPDRQLEVCMQCHLETTSARLPHAILRFDRGAFSYVPGTPLGDFTLYFDHARGTGHDEKFEIAHQAYRLRKSVCFQKSGSITCTTCHDPHTQPAGQAAMEHFAQACRNCHAKQMEHLIAAGRHSAAPNCIPCHMPKRRTEDVVHVVMTDHNIQRRPPTGDLLAARQERRETEETIYHGAVDLYYPAAEALGPNGALYVAAAQVKEFNNPGQGIPALAAALQQHPDAGAEFYFELAEAYAKTGRFPPAIEQYQEAIRRKAELRPAWLGLGRSYSRSGQMAQAVSAFEHAATIGLPDATILNDLGLGYLSQARTAEAIGVLRKAVALDASHAEAANNLGSALRESGDAAGAEAAYRDAIRAQPDFAGAQRNLANLLASRNAFSEAEFHYHRAIASDPASAETRVEYATALAGAEKYPQAREQFEAATRLNPDLAEAHTGLGDMLALEQKIGAAIDHYRRALALQPDSGAAHLGLASALDARGQRAEAIAHLQQAERSPDAAVRQSAHEALQSLRGSR